MDLLVVQLKAAIRRLLDTKGMRGRVLDKVNRYGEIVIGVILERPTTRSWICSPRRRPIPPGIRATSGVRRTPAGDGR